MGQTVNQDFAGTCAHVEVLLTFCFWIALPKLVSLQKEYILRAVIIAT